MVFNLDETEPQLQKNFINLLKENGYEYIEINNKDDLIANFKKQLRVFNNQSISNFDDILEYLENGSLDSKFDKLRSSFNDIRFIDFSNPSVNVFQVTEEVEMVGEYTNRYDVLILINGLPLVQIELKKSGVELINAFNQIQRYKKQSYSGLFDFIQLFVISNKVHTRYFLNNNSLNYDSTYVWGDNKDLKSFANSFLVKENLLHIISDYIFKDILTDEYKILRPYQISAVKKVLNQIENNENAYIWMSYNTGKTLTSLRLAQLLKRDYKVIYLTTNHLSKFPSELVIKNKKKFLKTFKRKNFVIANIRSILSLGEELDEIKDEKIVFILNEYEKYYGKYDPLNLKNTFGNSLFYCFTSAPIFDENLIFDETTKFIFDNKIYAYSLKDALMDKINLDFKIEYLDDDKLSQNYDLSSNKRIEAISNYILENISKRTHNQKFKSILFTSSNVDLITYYSYLKDSNLKIAPILRYGSEDLYKNIPMGDYFENCLLDYNDTFDASIEYRKVVDTSRISEKLEADIIKRFNNGEIDLLLIDESMLYDKYTLNILGNLKNALLNTVFLDCNLEYDSLFEVLTMVNELGCDEKTCGNIITFRDLRNEINSSIRLYSDNYASEEYKLKSYNYYLDNYNSILSTIDASKNFIKSYEDLSNNYHILERFDDFDFKQSQKDEFNTYKDKYEQEMIKIEVSKKSIPKFSLKSIDQYKIDLEFIDDLFNETFEDFGFEEEHIHHEDDASKVLIDVSHIDEDYIVEIDSGDLFANVEAKLNELQPIREKIAVRECNRCGKRYFREINFCHDDAGCRLIDSDKFTKACPKCGMKYDNVKFCNQDVGVRLEEINVFSKTCPECGRKFMDEINYCPQHPGVKLVKKEDLTKYCPKCGAEYPDDYQNCIRCESNAKLEEIKKTDIKEIDFTPNEYYNLKSHKNRIKDLSDLLTSENINKLSNFKFGQNDYDNLLENIIKTHEIIVSRLIANYEIDYDSLSILEKVLLNAKAFVKVEYKDSGPDLGRYIFNNIFIDDRKPGIGIEITTILHELSHFLISEILEQIIMEVLDTYKSNVIEAFVCYTLVKNDFNKLFDEFMAHSVEVKYTGFGYQDFSSYVSIHNDIAKSGEYNLDDIELAKIIGNTFARDIKLIIDSFINKQLREDILTEFENMNEPKNYKNSQFEIESSLKIEDFIRVVQYILVYGIENITSQEIERLQKYIVEFEKNNY